MGKEENMIFTDEMLSAFLDGELSDTGMAKIEEALLTDKVLDARLSRLQRANDAVRETYEDISREPVPQNLVDLIRDHVSDEPETQSKLDGTQSIKDDGNVVAFPSSQPTYTAKPWPSAVAASVALVVGIGVGMLQPFSGTGPHSNGLQIAGQLSKQSPIVAALESVPSAEAVNLSGGTEIEPVLSFESVDGQYCREAALHKETESVIFIACRNAESWAVELAVKTPPPNDRRNAFRPASTEAQTTIDAFLNKRMAGDAFDAEHEASLIDKNWRD